MDFKDGDVVLLRAAVCGGGKHARLAGGEMPLASLDTIASLPADTPDGAVLVIVFDNQFDKAECEEWLMNCGAEEVVASA